MSNREGKPAVILLVEDNEDHAELVTMSLNENMVRNDIFYVKDGEEALDYLLRRGEYSNPINSPRPDIILLDLRLPKIDGLEVLKVIKHDKEYTNLKNIPVVVLTTSEADKDLISAYDNCVNSYLVKPLDFDKFQQMIKDLKFYWLIWNKSYT